MTVATNAILFYGYLEPYVEEEPTWYDKVQELQEDDEWRAELEKKHGVELVCYCSDDDPMWGIGLKSPGYDVRRGDASEVNPEILKQAMVAEEIASLRAFADDVGLDLKDEEPGWWLVSFWG